MKNTMNNAPASSFRDTSCGLRQVQAETGARKKRLRSGFAVDARRALRLKIPFNAEARRLRMARAARRFLSSRRDAAAGCR